MDHLTSPCQCGAMPELSSSGASVADGTGQQSTLIRCPSCDHAVQVTDNEEVDVQGIAIARWNMGN